MRVRWIVLALVFSIALFPAIVQAKAAFSSGTINIWSSGGEDNCSSLFAVTGNTSNILAPCTSSFASTCISVDASINITRGGATNRTNFSVSGCELRMNMTADGSRIITNWGNFTVINSNITTNGSTKHSAITIKANSNFSMTNSFVSSMGWDSLTTNYGLELYSPVFVFNNNTLNNNLNGITLYSGANGSILTNITASYNTYVGITLFSSPKNTFTNIDTSNNLAEEGAGIYLEDSSNNAFTNIKSSENKCMGIWQASSSNNTFTNVTTNLNNEKGILVFGDNNIFTNITANSNHHEGIELSSGANNTFTKITANSNAQYGIVVSSASDNTFSNFNIWNCSAESAAYACIYSSTSQNNSFIKGTVNLTSKRLIEMEDSHDNLFQDVRFINTTSIPGGISITSYASLNSLNNTFLNCSFTGVTESVSANSQLIRQWYADIFTTMAGMPLAGVSLAITNGNMWTVTSDGVGFAPRQNIISYINNSGTVTAYTLSVTGSKTGYSDGSFGPQQITQNMLRGINPVVITMTGSDTTPPVRSNGKPSGSVTVGTNPLEMNLSTDEQATCKYSTSPSTPYGSMTGMTAQGGTFHYTALTGLGTGSHTYYINCSDNAVPPNINTGGYAITFSVTSVCVDDPPATTCGSWVCGTTTNNCGHQVTCPPGCSTSQTCSSSGVCLLNNGETCSDSGECFSGFCSGVDHTCQTQSGGGSGSTPGFEPSLMAIIIAASFAGLFLLKSGTRW